MKFNPYLACLLLALPLPAPLLAQPSQPGQASHSILDEPIEWTWAARPSDPDPALPNVLLIGDSITRAYYPDVARQLAGKANCYLFATSAASGDPRLPRQLHDLFTLYKLHFAVIHFNNGMHGWRYSEAQYAAGLPAMVAMLRHLAPHAKLVWTTTTPVLHDVPQGATNHRIDARNQAALALIRKDHIDIDDQHALMLQHQNTHSGDVHYTPQGSALQSTLAVSTILPLLPGK
jgi:hypothetical protein